MKKYLSILAILLVISPSTALASWWNPFSWSVFHKADTKTQILENRIKELESKIETVTASSTQQKAIETTTNIKKPVSSNSYEEVIAEQQKKAAQIKAQLDPKAQEKSYQEVLLEQQRRALEIRTQLELQEAQQAAQQQGVQQAQVKKAKLDSINIQIANLNAKYANDIAVAQTQGETLSYSYGLMQKITLQYNIDYADLQSQYQQILYSN